VRARAWPGSHDVRPTVERRGQILAGLRALVERRPLETFFALACAFSWWPMLGQDGGLFPFGPLVAALVVTAVVGGRAGLSDYLRRLARWRAGVGWYAAALAVPVALATGPALSERRRSAAEPVVAAPSGLVAD
jgi:uncharacterized protein